MVTKPEVRHLNSLIQGWYEGTTTLLETRNALVRSLAAVSDPALEDFLRAIWIERNPREALLDFVADAQKFELDADADNIEGRWIDRSRVRIITTPDSLRQLIETLGFTDLSSNSDPVQFLIDKATE